jgi:hypothetical protein
MKTNSQLIADCYKSGGDPVVTAGGKFISCGLKSKGHTYLNADGFYNSSGSEMAQKNIADATKNLAIATKNASDVNARYNSAVVERDKARQDALDCDARRKQHNTGPGKDRACGNRDHLYAKWAARDKDVITVKSALDSANAAVAKANATLISSQEAAEKIKNADPQYALSQQQITANENLQQSALNASVAKEAAANKTRMYTLIGVAALALTGLLVWMKMGKKINPS